MLKNIPPTDLVYGDTIVESGKDAGTVTTMPTLPGKTVWTTVRKNGQVREQGFMPTCGGVHVQTTRGVLCYPLRGVVMVRRDG